MSDQLELAPEPIALSSTLLDTETGLTAPEPGHLALQTMTPDTASPMTATFAETSWNVSSMLMKPMKVASFAWTTSNATNTLLPISSTDPQPTIPYQLLALNINNMQVNLLKSFTYTRYHLRFFIQITSTMFNCGELWIGYVPIHEGINNRDLQPNPTLLSQWNHVVISAKAPATPSFSVPWFHPQTGFNQLLDIPVNRALGYLFCYVYIPLQVPEGASTSLPINVMMTVETPQLKVPVNPVFTWLTPTDPPTKYARMSPAQLRHIRAQALAVLAAMPEGEEIPETQGGTVSSLWKNTESTVNSIGGAMEKAVNLDFSGAIGDLGNAVDTGMAVADTGVKLAAMFDRPRNLKAEVSVKQQLGPFQYGIGSDTSTRLGLNPFSQSHPDKNEMAGFGENDTSISARISLPIILDTIAWTSAQPLGTVLATYRIHPYSFYSALSQGYTLSPLAWLTRMFTYWKGGFKMRFTARLAKPHSGKLLFVYAPGYFSSTPPAFEEMFNWPQVIMDLTNVDEESSCTLDIPYDSVYPMLRCRQTTFTAAVSDITPLSNLGNVYVIVYNVLQHTESIATTIYIKPEIQALPDFHFAFPHPPLYIGSYEEIPIIVGPPGAALINPLPVSVPSTLEVAVMNVPDVTLLPSSQTAVTSLPPVTGSVSLSGPVSVSSLPSVTISSMPSVSLSGVPDVRPLAFDAVSATNLPLRSFNGILQSTILQPDDSAGSAFRSTLNHSGRLLVDTVPEFQSLECPDFMSSSLLQLEEDVEILRSLVQSQLDCVILKFHAVLPQTTIADHRILCEEYVKLQNLYASMTANVTKIHSALVASRNTVASITSKVILLERLDPPEFEEIDLTLPVAQADDNLGLGTPSTRPQPGHIGLEVTDDLLDVARRYSYLETYDFLPSLTLATPPPPPSTTYIEPFMSGNTILIPVTPFEVNPLRAAPGVARCRQPASLLGYISQAYLGWIGTIRYKVLFYNNVLDNLMINISHRPDMYWKKDALPNQSRILNAALLPSGYASVPYNIVDHHGIEFEVPFAAPYQFLFTTPYGEDSEAERFWQNGIVTLSVSDIWKATYPDRRQVVRAQVFIAAGDDFRFIGPRPYPFFNTYTHTYDETLNHFASTTGPPPSTMTTLTTSTLTAVGIPRSGVCTSTLSSAPRMSTGISSPAKHEDSDTWTMVNVANRISDAIDDEENGVPSLSHRHSVGPR